MQLKGTWIRKGALKKISFYVKGSLSSKELRERLIIKCIIYLLTKEHGDFRPSCLNISSRKKETHYIKKRRELEYFGDS